jgi:hypothetical protein
VPSRDERCSWFHLPILWMSVQIRGQVLLKPQDAPKEAPRKGQVLFQNLECVLRTDHLSMRAEEGMAESRSDFG